MSVDWKQMAIMEPPWYAPDLEVGSPALLMNFEETEWVLCRQHEDGFTPLECLGTSDIDRAKALAEARLDKEFAGSFNGGIYR